MSAIRDRSILIACIGAGSAVIAAMTKPICEAIFPGPPPQLGVVAVARADDPPITPTPNAIEGAWKQYILSEEDGAVYLGTLVVGRANDEYIISPRTQIEGEDRELSLGVFDVSFDGRVWSFNSKWGSGEVGNFELERVSPTVFEGDIRVAGQLSNRTRFVKIE